MKMPRVDRWIVVEFVGVSFLGVGVWAQWGAQWACMLWGVLFIGVSFLHAVMTMVLARARAAGHTEG